MAPQDEWHVQNFKCNIKEQFLRKNKKLHECLKRRKSYDNRHVFIPFMFDTFGFLAANIVDLLHKI